MERAPARDLDGWPSSIASFSILKGVDMMGTNPYEYDAKVPWIPQQKRTYAGGDSSAYPDQQHARSQPKSAEQKPEPPARMPKARALFLVRTCKKWLVAASLLGFLSLSGLVATQQVSAASNANQSSSGASQDAPAATSSDHHGFFHHHGDDYFGSNNFSQGSASSQGAVSGSHTS